MQDSPQNASISIYVAGHLEKTSKNVPYIPNNLALIK